MEPVEQSSLNGSELVQLKQLVRIVIGSCPARWSRVGCRDRHDRLSDRRIQWRNRLLLDRGRTLLIESRRNFSGDSLDNLAPHRRDLTGQPIGNPGDDTLDDLIDTPGVVGTGIA